MEALRKEREAAEKEMASLEGQVAKKSEEELKRDAILDRLVQLETVRALSLLQQIFVQI